MLTLFQKYFLSGFAGVMVAGCIHTSILFSTAFHNPMDTAVVQATVPKMVESHQGLVKYSQRDIQLAKIIQARFTKVSPQLSLEIAMNINRDTRGISWPTPLAVASIIEIESQYHREAVSDCGARGLMQVSPIWSGNLPDANYQSVSGNIRDGIYLLNRLYKKYDGNRMAAILSYNSGRYAYNAGQAWPVYWYRFESAHEAFRTVYQETIQDS